MSLPESAWTSVYNVFNPQKMLWGTALQSLFVQRQGSPTERLLIQLAPDRDPMKVIFNGHRGSGKSTELANLAVKLRDKFFVAFVDLEANLDMFNVSYVDVLFLMGLALFKSAQIELNRGLDAAPVEALKDALCTMVREQTENTKFDLKVADLLEAVATLSASAMAGPAAGKAAQALTRPFQLGDDGTEGAMRLLEVRPRVSEIIHCVDNVIAQVEAEAKKPVLMIVDGLDKIDLPLAYRVFAASDALARPTCNVVYAAPIVLRYSPGFQQAAQILTPFDLPNVKLHEEGRPDEKTPAGYDLMRDVIARRLRSIGRDIKDTIAEDALDRAIEMSGGVMRDLVRLVRDASVDAQMARADLVGSPAVEKAVYRTRRDFSAGLKETHVAELRHFAKTGQRSNATVEFQGSTINVADHLLMNSYMLCYSNDKLWFDVHPNVRPLIAE